MSEPEVILSVRNTRKLPEEIKTRLLSMNMGWTFRSGIWTNLIAYDTRTKKWEEFLEFLITSEFANDEMGLLITFQGSPEPGDIGPPDDQGRRTAISRFAESVWCSEFVEEGPLGFIGKVKPVKDGLPFLFSHFTNPPSDSYEALFSSGCYITTCTIVSYDWSIIVHIFRA